MSDTYSAFPEPLQAPDICLLLRAHAEQLWLHREVISVLRQVESRDSSLPEEQLGAAFAYLETVWIEALNHARETEASRALLDQAPQSEERIALCAAAYRYHRAVSDLRKAVALRVEQLAARGPDLAERGDELAPDAPVFTARSLRPPQALTVRRLPDRRPSRR